MTPNTANPPTGDTTMSTTQISACPVCRNPLVTQRQIPAAVIAEFVVEHRVLSGNRWDDATIVVSQRGTPTTQALADEACRRIANRFDASDAPAASDLRARETRRRVQTAERVMACTVCAHTHRENA